MTRETVSAVRRGIDFRDLRIDVTGDQDLRGYLGIDETRPGFGSIAYTVHVDTDADLAEFRHALRVFLRLSEEAARDEGLSPAQHQLLLAIRGHPDQTGVSVSDLAGALQLRNNSVVGLVDRTDAAGLTVSRADPGDARRRLVALTPSGGSILSKLSERHRAELRTLHEEMGELLRRLD